MKYRTYPKTDVTVSEVGFGLWTTSTGWWGDMTDRQAIELLHQARDLGVTLFDAADTYGNGRSEEQLGRAFEKRRGDVVYSTKFGYDFYSYAGERKGQNELPHDFSPAFVRFALEESLKRLRTETIDIYSIHNAHLSEIANDELFALLEDFKREGKIRIAGVALGPAIGWLVEGCEASRKRNVANVQMIYNMLEQYPGDAMLRAAYDANADTAFQIRVPHSSGMLEGRYTADTVFLPTDHRSHRPRQWLVNGVKKVETLRFLEHGGRTLGQAAIQWLLAEPRIVSVLPNIYDRTQLEEFAAAPDTARLSREELERVAALARTNFGVVEPPGKFKGTMSYEGLPATLATANA